MIPRYTRPAMGRIFSDQNRFDQWLAVELAASDALAELGAVPTEAAAALRAHAAFDIQRIDEIEAQVKHDVIAFTTAVAEKMQAAGHADASSWLHYGLTANDIVDTAQALVLNQASALIMEGAHALCASLKRRAFEFQHTVQIGRTHGVHAEPVTFGLKLALEIRHLQRTEVREAEEPFAAGQKGSSAMPHKRNPVVCEQICGLARVVRANTQAAFENIALWHERDISHSSVERIILPDSTTLTDYMLARMTNIVANMRVFPERMLRNLESTRGLVFSGQLLQDLVERGAPREDAYQWVQESAMAAWETDSSFREHVADDARIAKFMDKAALEKTFDLQRQLRYVDAIFARAFSEKAGGAAGGKA